MKRKVNVFFAVVLYLMLCFELRELFAVEVRLNVPNLSVERYKYKKQEISIMRIIECSLLTAFSVRIDTSKGVAVRHYSDFQKVQKYLVYQEKVSIHGVKYDLLYIGDMQYKLPFGIVRDRGGEYFIALIGPSGNPLIRRNELESIEKKCGMRFIYNRVSKK